MTDAVNPLNEPESENPKKNNCSDKISKIENQTEFESKGSELICEEKSENNFSSNMTKNKDCDNTGENNGDEKISVDSDKKDKEESMDCPTTGDKMQEVAETEEQQPSNKNSEKVNTEEKERQSSVDERSRPDPYSYCEWSENYESLEDDRPIEEVIGDPQKYILWAAEKNEEETVRKLLEEDPNLVNAKDNDLYTPLHRASYSNSVEVIKILLSFDADISARTTDGWEPLHCACKWDSVEAVSLLLQNGADINARTQGNITPLHLAASNVSGRRTLEFLLWQPYIDPNVKNDAGDTAYDIAYRTGPFGDLFELLEESVNEY